MIAIRDIAYVRYRAPDLDAMERFLLDFGLHRAERSDERLFMAGSGEQAFVHLTERGAPACLGFGLLAQQEDDLRRLSDALQLPVTDSDFPGGGRRLRLTDPAGFEVDVLWGDRKRAPQVAPAPLFNVSAHKPRNRLTVRLHAGPSRVHRLGHVVLRVPSFAAACAFYTGTFGFRVADSYYADDARNTVIAFLRAGLGGTPTDHHTLALVESPERGFDHSAFEVQDWDDLMIGHHHLLAAGHRHAWGVGRHVQGSQVFDYWRDPFGFKVEHWTDGDRIDEHYVPGHQPLDPAGLAQWAPPLPPDFFA